MEKMLKAVDQTSPKTHRLSLKPRMHDHIRAYLNEYQEQIFDLVDAFGSPLNLMFPQVIEDNIAAFREVYDRYNIQGRVYVSTKPNKSAAALKQAALCDVGVDVSSGNSLKFALG